MKSESVTTFAGLQRKEKSDGDWEVITRWTEKQWREKIQVGEGDPLPSELSLGTTRNRYWMDQNRNQMEAIWNRRRRWCWDGVGNGEMEDLCEGVVDFLVNIITNPALHPSHPYSLNKIGLSLPIATHIPFKPNSPTNPTLKNTIGTHLNQNRRSDWNQNPRSDWRDETMVWLEPKCRNEMAMWTDGDGIIVGEDEVIVDLISQTQTHVLPPLRIPAQAKSAHQYSKILLAQIHPNPTHLKPI